MILIGQYDSSFVRRIGITLTLYGLPFAHRPWSTFGDRDLLMTVHPAATVPVLLLDDGTALVDSKIIADAVDDMVPADRRLWPAPERVNAARAALGLATGLSDRLVSLFYERNLHTEPAPDLIARRELQLRALLDVLEQSRAAARDDWLFGARLTHPDIALACAIRHLRDSLPDMFDAATHPALAAHAARAEALPTFAAISQPFIPPS